MADQGGDVWNSFNDAVTAKGTAPAAGQIDKDGTTMEDLNNALDDTTDETGPEISDEAPPTLPPMETPYQEGGAGKLETLDEDAEMDGGLPGIPENIEQYRMKGMLEKKGHLIANWKNRFFTFDPATRGLKYFDKESDSSAKGEMTVTNVYNMADRNQEGLRDNRFDFVGFSSKKGELVLAVAAADRKTKDEWLTKLKGVVAVKSIHSRASKSSFLGKLDSFGDTLTRRSSARSLLTASAGADGKPRPWRAVRVTVLAADGVNIQRRGSVGSASEASGMLRCTLVPLDPRGDEMVLEKQRTELGEEGGGKVTWSKQSFIFGVVENMDQTSSILLKLKSSSGTDYGSVHLPLDDILKPIKPKGAGGDAAAAGKATEAAGGDAAKAKAKATKADPDLANALTMPAAVGWHQLESRKKSVGDVQGKVQLSVTEVAEPSKTTLEAACKQLAGQVEIKDRPAFMKMHEKCFLGSDAVESLQAQAKSYGAIAAQLTSEDAALFYANSMLRAKLIVCVPRRGPQFERFENKGMFYRFAADDIAAGVGAGKSGGYRADPTIQDMQQRVTVADFQVIKLLGTGAFGKVVMAKHKQTGKIVAIKVLEKSGMSEADKANTWAERTVLNQLQHPFVATLEFAFQTRGKLFIGMEFFAGGDLHHHMHRRAKGALGEPRCKFYASEVVAALAHLHSLKIVYRDLKGENVMIAQDGHVRLVDFGLAALQVARNTCTSLVGSPFYVAPEVLRNFKTKTGYGKAVDWWSTGVLIYEMLVGRTPFETDTGSRQRLYKNICSMPLRLPAYLHANVKDLLKGLLTRDPSKRMGTTGDIPEDIMTHPYWQDLDWEKLQAKEIPPPWVPDSGQEYVDKEFLRQKAPLLGTASDARDLYSSKGGEFEGFTVKKT